MRYGLLLLAWLSGALWADEAQLSRALEVQLPELIEDGAQVPLRIRFAGALEPGEYLQQVQVLAPKNPEPEVVSFRFFQPVVPLGLATRIRLSQSQTVRVEAYSNQGRVWQTDAGVRISESGCLTGTALTGTETEMRSPRVALPPNGEAGEVRAQVRHPMESGLRNGIRDLSITPSRVTDLQLLRGSGLLLEARFHSGMAANPYVSIWLEDTRDLRFVWRDDRGRSLSLPGE